MDNFIKDLYFLTSAQTDAYSKALANFIFREVIEDAHEKYNISNDDMKNMCQNAVDRAALFLSLNSNKDLYRAFSIYAINSLDWDDANIDTEFAHKFKETLRSVSNVLKNIDA